MLRNPWIQEGVGGIVSGSLCVGNVSDSSEKDYVKAQEWVTLR